MIDRVHFENFKSLANVTLHFGRFTALVGANGCGKSSVLQGLHLLSRTGLPSPRDRINSRRGRFASIYGGARAPQRLMYRGGTGELVIAMRDSNGDELRVEIRVTGADAGKPSQSAFDVVVGPVAPLHCTVPPSATSWTKSWEEVLTVLDHPRVRRFASAVYLHIDASEMVQTSIPEDESPRMAFDGSGLASVLAWMKGAAEDELAELTSDLRQVVPGVKRIRTLRERVPRRRIKKMDIDGQPVWRPVDESQIGDRFAIEFDDGSEVPSDLLSEGTVLALGLLTKLREPERPRLILLDDLDRGLHLGAQAKLVQVLRALMKRDPELQIVCTTHSPYLLDLFEPAEVRVLALDSERRTHARPLTEHPDFGKWKFGTQTGELWAALGEAWVTAGEPG
jgi:ABC-type phosphonate transport system ATPase subunit